jgi:chromosome segregation ATPase
VSNITDLLSRRDAQHQSEQNTKEALQDRLVFLETQETKLQDDNKELKFMNANLNAQVTKIKERGRLQGLEIEKLIDERDDALNRLEKVESAFKAIFSGDKVTKL